MHIDCCMEFVNMSCSSVKHQSFHIYHISLKLFIYLFNWEFYTIKNGGQSGEKFSHCLCKLFFTTLLSI